MISIGEFYIAKKKFHSSRNPVTLYVLVWNVMIFLYELPLVYYHEITLLTWLTVIVFQGIFVVTCLFGGNYLIKSNQWPTDNSAVERNRLGKVVVALTFVAAIAIVPNFFFFIQKYSFEFMDQMNNVYNDRLMNNRGYETIPYLGTLVYLAVMLSGVYARRFGFNKIILFPLLMSLMDTLPGGGRSGIIIEILLFALPFYLFGNKQKGAIKVKRVISNRRKTMIVAGLSIVALTAVFWKMSSVRSRWIGVNQYMTDTMVDLVQFSPTIYKTYTYITMPFVALSEYLKNPDYLFGINTFGMFYNLLNKVGFSLPYQRYQIAYYVPMACNTATYIRELVQDFTYVGGVVAVAVLGFIMGLNYNMVRVKKDIGAEGISTILGTIIVMSFFVFFLRETVFWVMLIVLPVCIKYVYAYERKDK